MKGLRWSACVSDYGSDEEHLWVNCGRCGKAMLVRLEQIKNKRTIDCEECEKRLCGKIGYQPY